MDIVNRYAGKIQLPFTGGALLTFNTHFQNLVRQITILHQFQRTKDEQGRLITQLEDLRLACDLLFSSIVLQSDDLDAQQKDFFGRMKDYVKKQAKENPGGYEFTQYEIRLALGESKTQCFRFFKELKALEYINITTGSANKGFKFIIARWNDLQQAREKVKEKVTEQLNRLSDAE